LLFFHLRVPCGCVCSSDILKYCGSRRTRCNEGLTFLMRNDFLPSPTNK
jgi:hypothetical protein